MWWPTSRSADSWPFDVFQIDDGFQPAIGDWLATNDKFESSLDELAVAHQRGRARARPVDRSVPRRHPTPTWRAAHPDWFAPSRVVASPRRHGQRALGRPGARARHHAGPRCSSISSTSAARSSAAGFRYLKLDFTYAPGAGTDATPTPRTRRRNGCAPGSTPSVAARATTSSSSDAARRSARASVSSTACASDPTSRRGGRRRRTGGRRRATARPRPATAYALARRRRVSSCTAACGSTIPTA